MQIKGPGSSNHLKKGSLVNFFEPKNIAVIGSMRENPFGSRALIENLLEAGFREKIYPVDFSCNEVLGLKVFTSINDIPEKIDLSVIITECRTVPTLIVECAAKGVKAAIILSGGFAESEEGLALQTKVTEVARQSGMAIIGPNSAGIVNTENGFICCPYVMGDKKINVGSIALCAQNSMIGPHVFPYADLHYGVSKICDLGNKCDVDESDILEYLENDPSTKVIAMHTDDVRDTKRFLEIARRVTYQKPTLMLKSTRTNYTGIVSTPQDGSLSLDNQIFDGICKQVGIIRLDKFSELFEIPKFFAYQPMMKGNKLAIVSHTGMGAALAIDEGIKYNLSNAKLSPITARNLSLIFPNLWKTFIDIGPLASSKSDYMSVYPEILRTILADDNVDSVLHILWANPGITLVEDYVNIYRELGTGCQKPIAIWLYGPKLPIIYDIAYNLEELGFPVFLDLEVAIKAIGVAYQYATWKKGKHQKETIPYS